MQQKLFIEFTEQMSKIESLIKQGAKVSITEDGVILRTSEDVPNIGSQKGIVVCLMIFETFH